MSRAECTLALKVFGALAERQKTGNIVFSPHAAVRAAAFLAREAEGVRRERLLDFLGVEGSADELWRDLEVVEKRLREGRDYGMGYIFLLHYLDSYEFLEYSSFVGRIAPGGQGHMADGFVARRLAEAERRASTGRGSAVLSAMDLKISGVPGVAQVQFRTFADAETDTTFVDLGGAGYSCWADYRMAWWSAELFSATAREGGRASVAFSLPSRNEGLEPPRDIPIPGCSAPLHARVPGPGSPYLDFSAPTFCARGDLDLGSLFPELVARHGASREVVSLPSRLLFDSRATFNSPLSPHRSPAFRDDLLIVAPARREEELDVSEPFFVTITDPQSGVIFYVAWIREPGDPWDCQ